MNNSMLPRWIPARIRFAVREACRDNDGYWIYLHDEFEVDDGSTISGDTPAEALEYFWGGRHNAALTEALKSRPRRSPARKIKPKFVDGPMVPAPRPPGVTDRQWAIYLGRVSRWNEANK